MFWEGNWLVNAPICEPILYNIVHMKHDTVENMMSRTPPNRSLRRVLVENKLVAWYDLVGKLIAQVNLNEQLDTYQMVGHKKWTPYSSVNVQVCSSYSLYLEIKSTSKIKINLNLQRGLFLPIKENFINKQVERNQEILLL